MLESIMDAKAALRLPPVHVPQNKTPSAFYCPLLFKKGKLCLTNSIQSVKSVCSICVSQTGEPVPALREL